MPVIPPVKGTRDFYPEAMALRNWLYQNVRQASQAYGYQEYETPFLERLDLYAAKSGEELVREQAYVFPDRGGDEIALRPELTPSLARMVAARARSLPRPIRWWSFGPIWRYERPQKGRTREFFQWNIDLLGVDSPEARPSSSSSKSRRTSRRCSPCPTSRRISTSRGTGSGATGSAMRDSCSSDCQRGRCPGVVVLARGILPRMGG